MARIAEHQSQQTRSPLDEFFEPTRLVSKAIIVLLAKLVRSFRK